MESGRVHVSVSTEMAEEVVRGALRIRRAEVERVALGHEVSEAPQTHEEGDCTATRESHWSSGLKLRILSFPRKKRTSPKGKFA
ncbi:hypothetical protein IAI58_16995 (plasmid) [Roseomonas marmotae]|uniref:Uncharacterized protein n=1 Tax=Roseomonas marmotae TaxID=2768161 RepID=A0ABS3KJQ3_9PROT|nr:hypothetical protein [Roseomonas marmotae]QTI81073.1 hypothetical protein IAI58_16995 [Roseomonas marmotae]